MNCFIAGYSPALKNAVFSVTKKIPKSAVANVKKSITVIENAKLRTGNNTNLPVSSTVGLSIPTLGDFPHDSTPLAPQSKGS